jgi:retron-type reverse transcriptase
MGDQPGNREESLVTCKSYDIPKTLVWEAWLQVKANQGAAGIDAETIERFETKLAANLYKLWNRMSSGSYFPPPAKGVPIPKKSGGVGHPDATGILHLTQFGLGMIDEDGLS